MAPEAFVVIHGSLIPSSLTSFVDALRFRLSCPVYEHIRASHRTSQVATWRDVEDLCQWIRSRRLKSTLFGHSLGALVAAAVASECSDVTQLILYEPPFVADEYHPPNWQDRSCDELVIEFFQYVFGEECNHPAVQRVVKESLQRWSSTAAAQLLKMDESWRASVTEHVLLSWLQGLHDVLVVTGSRSPQRYHKRAEALTAGGVCRCRVFPGFGHAGPIVSSDALAKFTVRDIQCRLSVAGNGSDTG
jgi:pimeloyl-ACP methyl ester carboxylesterase